MSADAPGTLPLSSTSTAFLTGLSADIATVVSALVQSVVISRLLGPENRGLFFLTVLTATLAALVGELGLSVSGVTFAAGKRWLLPQLHWITLAVSLLAGLVTSAIFVGASSFWAQHVLHGMTKSLFILVAAAVPMLVFGQVASAELIGGGRVPSLAAIRVFVAVVTPVAIVGAAWLSGGSPFWTALAWVLVATTFAIACGFVLFRRVSVTRPDIADAREILGFGLRGYVGNLSQYGFLRIDVLFVSARLGAEAVGIYSLASVLAERLALAGSALYHAGAQRIGGASPNEAGIFTARLVRLTLLLLVPTVVLLALGAPYFIPALYGDSFRGAVVPFVLLLPGVVCLTVWYLISLFLVAALRRPATTTAIQSFALAVSVPLYYFAVVNFGIRGAALVSSIVYMIVLACAIPVFLRSSGVGIGSLAPRWSDARYAASRRRAFTGRSRRVVP